jgi:hypothetical protein
MTRGVFMEITGGRQVDHSTFDTCHVFDKWHGATWPRHGLPCGTHGLVCWLVKFVGVYEV